MAGYSTSKGIGTRIMYNLVDHVPWKCEQIHSGVVHLPALSPWHIHSLREHHQTLCQPSNVPNTKNLHPNAKDRPNNAFTMS